MGSLRSDADVIARSLKASEAFAEIYDRHQGAIHGFIARRLGWDAAEEATADVFVVAFGRRASYNAAYPDARPWLYGIALNVVRRYARTSARRARAHLRLVGLAVDGGQDDETQIDDAAEARYLAGLLPGAMAALSQRDRETLLLHCWEGLSYTDIALALDIPVGTVRSRMHRTRSVLREHFDIGGQSTDIGGTRDGD
jgi:RNA polymerase sigma-70 factor (ECF subfamily)